MFVVARAIVNVYFILDMAFTLDKRNPEGHQNMQRYLLAWFEAPVVCLLVLKLVASSLWGGGDFRFGQEVRFLAGFSALSLLPSASPTTVVQTLQDTLDGLKGNRGFSKLKCCEKVLLCVLLSAELLRASFLVGIAITALLVKVAALDFVAVEYKWWTWQEWKMAAQFVNSLAGLNGDVTVEASRRMLGTHGGPKYADRFFSALSEALRDAYPKKHESIVMALTFTFSDICLVFQTLVLKAEKITTKDTE